MTPRTKTTAKAVNAFIQNRNFNSPNTNVIAYSDGKVSMYLFGNCIANKDEHGKITIRNCGWQTNTTKERLNGLPNVSIRQIKGEWYLNGEHWDGQSKQIN